MQIEQGSVVKGKVTGLTDFGAFVELEGGKTGMIHISEVSTSYVKDIKAAMTVPSADRVPRATDRVSRANRASSPPVSAELPSRADPLKPSIRSRPATSPSRI